MLARQVPAAFYTYSLLSTMQTKHLWTANGAFVPSFAVFAKDPGVTGSACVPIFVMPTNISATTVSTYGASSAMWAFLRYILAVYV
jgi:hypothetical protein